MKPVDVKSSTYIASSKEINDEDIKAFLQKTVFPNCSEKVLVIKRVKTLCRGNMLIVILKAKKLFERFTKKQLQRTNQKELRVEKVIKRKGDKISVKWKDYDSSFNSWIDKKDIVYK